MQSAKVADSAHHLEMSTKRAAETQITQDTVEEEEEPEDVSVCE